MNSQIVQHVSHVAAVIEGVSVCLLSLVHLHLALENISQVTPCCAVKEHNTILRIKTKNSFMIKGGRKLFCIQVMIFFYIQHCFCVFGTSLGRTTTAGTLCKSIKRAVAAGGGVSQNHQSIE